MECRALKFSRFNFVEKIHRLELETGQTHQQWFKVEYCFQNFLVHSHWGMQNKSPSRFIFEYVRFVQIFNENQAQLRLILAQLRPKCQAARARPYCSWAWLRPKCQAGHLGLNRHCLSSAIKRCLLSYFSRQERSFMWPITTRICKQAHWTIPDFKEFESNLSLQGNVFKESYWKLDLAGLFGVNFKHREFFCLFMYKSIFRILEQKNIGPTFYFCCLFLTILSC